MKIKKWQKNILSMFVIAGGGFILFNIAFMLAAAVMTTTSILTGSLGKPPILGWFVYLIIITIISIIIYRAKLNELIKATYSTVPLMIILLGMGIILYRQPQWVAILSGALIVSIILGLIYRFKLSWLYYFATGYVAILALIINLTGMEI